MTDHKYMVQVQEIKGLRAERSIMQFWTDLFKYLFKKTISINHKHIEFPFILYSEELITESRFSSDLEVSVCL